MAWAPDLVDGAQRKGRIDLEVAQLDDRDRPAAAAKALRRALEAARADLPHEVVDVSPVARIGSIAGRDPHVHERVRHPQVVAAARGVESIVPARARDEAHGVRGDAQPGAGERGGAIKDEGAEGAVPGAFDDRVVGDDLGASAAHVRAPSQGWEAGLGHGGEAESRHDHKRSRARGRYAADEAPVNQMLGGTPRRVIEGASRFFATATAFAGESNRRTAGALDQCLSVSASLDDRQQTDRKSVV